MAEKKEKIEGVALLSLAPFIHLFGLSLPLGKAALAKAGPEARLLDHRLDVIGALPATDGNISAFQRQIHMRLDAGLGIQNAFDAGRTSSTMHAAYIKNKRIGCTLRCIPRGRKYRIRHEYRDQLLTGILKSRYI